MESIEFKLEHAASDRLDRVAVQELGRQGISISRSHITDLVHEMRVFINGSPRTKAGSPVVPGDLLRIERPWELSRKPRLSPKPRPLHILFEDEAIIVVNKPQGLTVHPGAGTGTEGTLIEAVIAHVGTGMLGEFGQGQSGDELRPGIVHRLDRDTSGVMVIAKTRRAHGILAQAFKDKRDLKREYIALMQGLIPEPIDHESWLKRDEISRVKFRSLPNEVAHSRWASSYFEPLARFAGALTLARVVLKTGRTHQIRLHAVDLGAPIVGDPLYRGTRDKPSLNPQKDAPGGRVVDPAVLEELKKVEGTGQFLHAYKLEFIHPLSGIPMGFIEKYPERFHLLVEKLAPFRAL